MKTMTDLTPAQVGRITDLYRTRGATADTVKRVARTWQITESDAQTLGTAATTAAPKKTVTESAPDLPATAANTDALASRKANLAIRLHSQVLEAESKPIGECSIQELEALAAAAGSDAGMFGA
jgi:hypothetical protein